MPRCTRFYLSPAADLGPSWPPRAACPGGLSSMAEVRPHLSWGSRGLPAGHANKKGRGRPACLVSTCPFPAMPLATVDLRALLGLQGPQGQSLSLRPLGIAALGTRD